MTKKRKRRSPGQIVKATQEGINMVLPYVVNCPLYFRSSNPATYISIQPIEMEQKEELVSKIKKLEHRGATWWHQLGDEPEGRIQFLLEHPRSGDDVKEVVKNTFTGEYEEVPAYFDELDW